MKREWNKPKIKIITNNGEADVLAVCKDAGEYISGPAGGYGRNCHSLHASGCKGTWGS